MTSKETGKKVADLELAGKKSTPVVNDEVSTLIDALDRISDGILVLDKNWIIKYINPKGVEIVNREDAVELIGKNMWGEFPEGINLPFYNAFYKALETQQEIYIEEYFEPWDRYFEDRIYPSPNGLTIYFNDITERKIAADDLIQDRAFTESILNASQDIIYVYDLEERISLYVNRVIGKHLGYSQQEIMNMGAGAIPMLMAPEDLDNYVKNILPSYYALSDQALVEYDFRMRRKDGGWASFHAKESVFKRNEDGLPVQIFGIGTDNRIRAQVEAEKRHVEDRFRLAMENISDGVVIYDREKRIQFVNEATCKITGYSALEFIGPHNPGLLPEDVYKSYLSFLDRVYETCQTDSLEIEAQFEDMELRTLKITCVPILNEQGEIQEVIGIIRDLTDIRKAQKLVEGSETRYRLLFENAPYAMGVYQDGKIAFVNPACVHLTGARNFEELMGKSIKECVRPEKAEEFIEQVNRIQSGEAKSFQEETEFLRLDGSSVTIEFTAAPFQFNGRPAVQVIALDVSEKKKAMSALADELVRRRMLIERSRDGIVILDENGKVFDANLRAAEMLGYTPEEFNELSIWDWEEKYQQDEVLDLIRNVDEKGITIETRHKRKDGSYLDVEISVNGSDFAEKHLNFCVIRDITVRKKMEQELRSTLEQVRQAIGVTFRVLIAAIESRDPYTAGHQKNVAELSKAIAEELGLSKDQIAGLYFAAGIHDIGKISIPSEILSKPTRLTPTEYALVQEHVQNGYHILKDIVSPWPVADIVLQHHERMNGSGYPLGLKGEEILIETRILSVADVVEAMASHRPYRPALGIEAALEEIEKNKGSLFDPQVVDVCLKLFREGKFSFNEKSDVDFAND